MIYNNTKEILLYIRQYMIGKDISINELAQKMGKTHSAVSGLFRQPNISLEKLNEICNALNLELEINMLPKDSD